MGIPEILVWRLHLGTMGVSASQKGWREKIGDLFNKTTHKVGLSHDCDCCVAHKLDGGGVISVARKPIISDDPLYLPQATGIDEAAMTSAPGRISLDNKHISSPLTTLFRKASAHRPSGGSTHWASTQPQSPLIHTKFRGSVATASSYDTSGFQDEESIVLGVRTSDPTVRIS